MTPWSEASDCGEGSATDFGMRYEVSLSKKFGNYLLILEEVCYSAVRLNLVAHLL